MITLRDVIDIRDGRYYSVVRVKSRMAKWFIPANEGGEDNE